MRRLVRATALLSAGSAASILAAVLRAKALAAWLGPQGTGVMGQLSALTAVLAPLGTLGAGNGVVALIAEARGRGDLVRVARIQRTTITLSWFVAGGIALLAALGSPWIARGIYEGAEYFWVVLLGAASVPFLAIASLRISMLQGHEAIREMAVLNAVVAAVGITTILPLAWFFRLPGAAFQSLLVAGAYAWLSARAIRPFSAKVRAAESLAPGPRPLVDRSLLPVILRYGGSALLVGLSSTLTLLVLRSVLVQRLGLAENGIYQVCVGISGLYMPMILSSITASVWPQIAAQTRDAETVDTMRQAVRLSFLLMTAVAATVLIAAPMAIPLLYSSRFLPALALLPLQFLGDYFRAGAYMFGVWLVPRNRLRPWVLFDVVYGLVLLGSFLLLTGPLGIRSVVVAYVAAHVSHAVLHYALARRSLRFTLGPDNRRLLLASFALLAGFVAWTPRDAGGAILGAAAAAVWALLVVRKSEWLGAWRRGRALLQGWATKQ
ncbi:MAG TPA: oligosaccharide flippase family protein [Candidatus Eisenbacteria bacterium]